MFLNREKSAINPVSWANTQPPKEHLQCSVVKCSEFQFRVVYCIAEKYSAVQCNAVQCSAVQYSTV